MLPIGLALAWPARLDHVATACDFSGASEWTFEPVDNEAFPALGLAFAAGRAGGTVPAAFNAANEEAVEAFRTGLLQFTGISDVLARILEEGDHVRSNPRDIDDVWATEDWARRRAREIIAADRAVPKGAAQAAQHPPAGKAAAGKVAAGTVATETEATEKAGARR